METGEILFHRSFAERGEDAVVPEGYISTIRTDGTGMTDLVSSPGWNGYPAWSPDGTRIAFVRTRQDTESFGDVLGQIFVVDADGGNETRMTTDLSPKLDLAWAPGPQIAFARSGTSADGGDSYQVCLLDPDTGAVTQVTGEPQQRSEDVAYSPGTLKAVTKALDPNEPNPPSRQCPAWSPDGKHLVFWQNADTSEDLFGAGHELHIASLGEGSDRRITSGFSDTDPCWSPDGTSIAFVRRSLTEIRGRAGFESSVSMCIVDIADGAVRAVTDDPPYRGNEGADYQHPSWSPDGSHLVVTRDARLWVLNISTGEKSPLIGPDMGQSYYPSWRPITTSA